MHAPTCGQISSMPPVNPSSGEVYLYKVTELSRGDYLCDQIAWKNDGTKNLPKRVPEIKVQYFSTRYSKGFFRKSYQLLDINTSKDQYLVVWYSGDETTDHYNSETTRE